MHVFIPILLADQANERHREADRRRLAALVASSHGTRVSPLRRALARAFVALSRASAAAVRRLDVCLADDLARGLVPGDGR